MVRKVFVYLLLIVFILTNGIPTGTAQTVVLPAPGTRLSLSPAFTPPLLRGIKVYSNDPFRFDFILDKGDSKQTNGQLTIDSNRLIKYFLASLTIPETDLWVNLSPYEKDRIVPEAFGQTEMGRDLLAQDYILKQITASVIYPESAVGKAFWAKVYAEAQKRYGTTDVPVDTFNKVWIVPEKATVSENTEAAFVVESQLRVMLEEDYIALENNATLKTSPATNKLGSDIVREVVIPILNKEVNEGENFALLRQIYNSLILATWYKRKVKVSILGQAYADKQKINGIDIAEKNEKERIWSQYVEAFKKGAYNFIKEEYDPETQQTLPRKYFSGGTALQLTTAAYQSIPFNGFVLKDFNFDGAMIIEIKTQIIDSAMETDTGSNALRTNNVINYRIVPQNEIAERFHRIKQSTPGKKRLVGLMRDENNKIQPIFSSNTEFSSSRDFSGGGFMSMFNEWDPRRNAEEVPLAIRKTTIKSSPLIKTENWDVLPTELKTIFDKNYLVTTKERETPYSLLMMTTPSDKAWRRGRSGTLLKKMAYQS